MKKSRKTVVKKTVGKFVSRERVRTEQARMNSVSIGLPYVIDFGDTALREAFRFWWHPYDMGPD